MGSGFARRVQKGKLRLPKESLEKLTAATKALSNLDQVKQLNDLLGVVREVTPYLEETRTVCAMLIEENKGLERRLARQEHGIRLALSSMTLESGRSLLDIYERETEAWDKANPELPVLAANNGTPQASQEDRAAQ